MGRPSDHGSERLRVGGQQSDLRKDLRSCRGPDSGQIVIISEWVSNRGQRGLKRLDCLCGWAESLGERELNSSSWPIQGLACRGSANGLSRLSSAGFVIGIIRKESRQEGRMLRGFNRARHGGDGPEAI
eukprot:scaffold647951_cov52-Prasinocladus_malaysianus.AAC.2